MDIVVSTGMMLLPDVEVETADDKVWVSEPDKAELDGRQGLASTANKLAAA